MHDCMHRGNNVLWWHVHELLVCPENKRLTLGLLSINEILVTMMKRVLKILKDPKRTLS